MTDSDRTAVITPREFDLAEKLHAERNSAVHLRIAAVEARAQMDRELQAAVNKSLGESLSTVKTDVQGLKSSTEIGFKDVKYLIYGLSVLVALTLIANLPGLAAVLKGKIP